MNSKNPLRIGGVPEHFNLPWHLALERQRFQEAEFSVEYVDFPGGTGAMTRGLKENSIDVALVLSEGAVANVLRGNQIRIVKVYVKSPLIWGVHVAADSDLLSIEECMGKRYAISRQGSGSHLMAIVDAAERGWPVDNMEFVKVGNLEGAREAFRKNEADVFLWERFMTQPLVDLGEFRRVGERCVPWPAFVVAIRQDVLDERGPDVRRMFEIIDDECELLMKNPEAVNLIATRYELKQDEVQTWFEHVQWNSGFDCPTEDLERVIGYLEKIGVVEDSGAEVSDVWSDLPQ